MQQKIQAEERCVITSVFLRARSLTRIAHRRYAELKERLERQLNDANAAKCNTSEQHFDCGNSLALCVPGCSE